MSTLMRKTSLLLLLCICMFSFSGLFVFGQKKQTKKESKTSVKPPISVKKIISVENKESLEQQIVRIAEKYQIDPRLFQSLIYTESVFRIKAVSYKGAACYTQLMPATARRFGLRVDAAIDERFDAEKCLTAGASYLSWLMQTFRGDVRLALAGYNAGEGSVMKYGWRIPPFRETVQYVEKICALYYGQSGHGFAMAYNQPQAQGWINEMYSRTRPRIGNTGLVQPTAFVRLNSKVTAQSPAPNKPEGGAVAKPGESKKPILTRVDIEESHPRLRTQSLSFGNN